jgi:hypothetical protein
MAYRQPEDSNIGEDSRLLTHFSSPFTDDKFGMVQVSVTL